MLVTRIKELCKERGHSIRQMEQDLGFSNGYIKGLSEERVPYHRLIAIAKYLETTPEYLMYGGDLKGGLAEVETGRIPVLGTVAAGLPLYATENIIDYEEIPLERKRTGEWFGLRIKGDSMYPMIWDGDTVICKKTPNAVTGQIVVALIDREEAVCKKFIQRQDGITLKSVNEEYGNYQYSYEQMQEIPVEIIGTVYEIRRKTPVSA